MIHTFHGSELLTAATANEGVKTTLSFKFVFTVVRACMPINPEVLEMKVVTGIEIP